MELFKNTRDVVYSPKRQDLYERNRYSPAIRSNGFLFVSGQVGSLDDGSPQEGLTAQVRQAFENLNNILAAAGDRKSVVEGKGGGRGGRQGRQTARRDR